MITRKENLLVLPIQQKRYNSHRNKVRNALPRIDNKSPEQRTHVLHKQKKLQSEMERCLKIEKDNFILLQHLNDICKMKRVDNRWLHKQPMFLRRVELFHVIKSENNDEIEMYPLKEDINLGHSRKDRCFACHTKNFTNSKKESNRWQEHINVSDATWNRSDQATRKQVTDNILPSRPLSKKKIQPKSDVHNSAATVKGTLNCRSKNFIDNDIETVQNIESLPDADRDSSMTAVINFPASTNVTLHIADDARQYELRIPTKSRFSNIDEHDHKENRHIRRLPRIK